MKKYLLVVLAILLVGAAAGGGAWYWRRSHDQLGLARQAMTRGDLRAAQLALRTVVRDNPANAEAHYRLGAVQLQLGDAVAAEKELKLARGSGWNPRIVVPLLARSYLAQNRFREVLQEFQVQGLPAEEAGPLLVTHALARLGLREQKEAEQAIAEAERLAPGIVEAPLAAARIALAGNDAGLAEQKVDRALAINPHSIDGLLLKGGLLHGRRDYDGAVAAFSTALERAPDAVSIRLERANTLIGLGQDNKAREDVEAVLKADGRNPLGNYFLAVLLVRQGNWSGAEAALQKISPIISRFPRGDYFQALVKINLGQVEQAIEAAGRYVSRAPHDIAGYKLLARIDARARRPQEMVAVLKQAIDAGLADVELLELLGGAYIQAGQVQLAVQTLDKATELAAGDPEVLARIAGIRLGIGDAGGAERDLARSLELAPDRSETGERLVIAALAAGDIDRAAAELERVRRLPGGNPVRMGNLLGLVRLGQLDLEGARAAFESTLAADQNAAAARLNLAKVLTLLNRAADAEALLMAVLEKEPANTAALSAISGLLLADHRTERLVQLMEAARRTLPGNAALTIAEADMLANAGDARKALALVDEIPKEQAATPAVLAARARLQEALGLERDAQDSWRRLLAGTPGDLEARRRLAESLLRAGDANEARGVLRRGLELAPGNLVLMQNLVGIEFRLGGLDAALATAGALAKESANLPAARLLKGGLYMSVQRYADAAAAYQAELQAEPSAVLAIGAATALGSAGRGEDGRALLQNWIGRQPNDIDAVQALAGLELQMHRNADAEKHLAAVLEARPSDPVALNNLAWIYQERGDPRARAMAQKAYLLSPSPQAADTLGWVLTRQGNPTVAVLLLRQAARQLSNDPAVFYHLAVALEANGQKEQAVNLLTQLVNAGAEFDDKPAARKLLEQLGGATKQP